LNHVGEHFDDVFVKGEAAEIGVGCGVEGVGFGHVGYWCGVRKCDSGILPQASGGGAAIALRFDGVGRQLYVGQQLGYSKELKLFERQLRFLLK